MNDGLRLVRAAGTWGGFQVDGVVAKLLGAPGMEEGINHSPVSEARPFALGGGQGPTAPCMLTGIQLQSKPVTVVGDGHAGSSRTEVMHHPEELPRNRKGGDDDTVGLSASGVRQAQPRVINPGLTRLGLSLPSLERELASYRG
jgi:hypothetical protein